MVAADIAEGKLAVLPIDTRETKGPIGLTMRTDATPSMPLAILMQIPAKWPAPSPPQLEPSPLLR